MANSELNQFVENVDENLECTICFKRLKNPKSLNCLHTFCLACLEDWVKEKDRLTCPTCSKSYQIPEGGLEKLPPNTILNNLLETIEQFSKTGQMKCVCKGQAKNYCQECRHYLCSTHSEDHKIMPISANHKLYSVEDVQSMSPLQMAALHPPICSLHNEPFKFFCSICNIPICMHCTITDHNAWEGNHKPLSISKAFQTFKETSKELEKEANDCKNKLQDGLKAIIQTVTKLQKSKDKSLRDIDNHVQEMVKIVKDNGDKMKNEVEEIYKKKKKVLDVQMDELKTTMSDINTKLSFLNQLLKSDEATAMQSSEKVIKAIKDRLSELPATEMNDEKIHFYINQQKIDSFQCDIAYVSHMRAAECLTLQGPECVTQGQKIIVKVIKPDECKIHANQLKATWTHPTGETNITQVEEDDNGGFFVKGKCIVPGVCKLDVSAGGEPIRQSPMVMKVEEVEGLVNTININKEFVRDVVKCEHDCLLVSSETNQILKYKQSGECIGTVTIPEDSKAYRMYKMKNGNIIFSDLGNIYKCIKIISMDGEVIKSMGEGVLKRPFGIHVDETSNVVYVADSGSRCVFTFNIDSGQMIQKIGTPGSKQGQLGTVTDVTLTNQGHILILEYDYSILQLFNNKGSFIKVLVQSGDENGKLIDPRGVVVDEENNIIISSNHKLQLFSSDGNFIKRIDKPEDGINNPRGLSIISHHPRTVAVANNGNKSVDIFNY